MKKRIGVLPCKVRAFPRICREITALFALSRAFFFDF